MIAFVGSVFSPYYAWARRHGGGRAPAEAHNALNVALYRLRADGRVHARWAMTERGASALARGPTQLQIGPSHLAWQDGELHLALDEWTAPWPRQLRGRLRVRPGALPGRDFALDADGRHRWQPIAPAATVEVEFDQPALRWQGSGYLDANHGQRPLADDFSHWHWSRADTPGGGCSVLYDLVPRQAPAQTLALHIDVAGGMASVAPPPAAALPRSAWGLSRSSRSEAGTAARWLATLESGPFYSRGLVQSHWHGQPLTAVHETLDLRRFSRPWVQAMLPFRMPRRG